MDDGHTAIPLHLLLSLFSSPLLFSRNPLHAMEAEPHPDGAPRRRWNRVSSIPPKTLSSFCASPPYFGGTGSSDGSLPMYPFGSWQCPLLRTRR